MIRKFVINTMWLLLMIVISGLVYIRMAPDDLTSIHNIPASSAVPGKQEYFDAGIIISERVKAKPQAVLADLHKIITATPRTTVLVGSVEEGMISYVTRSKVFGFPDYTTMRVLPEEDYSRLTIYSRLRFGLYDFKVNSRRLYKWMDAIKAENSF